MRLFKTFFQTPTLTPLNVPLRYFFTTPLNPSDFTLTPHTHFQLLWGVNVTGGCGGWGVMWVWVGVNKKRQNF